MKLIYNKNEGAREFSKTLISYALLCISLKGTHSMADSMSWLKTVTAILRVLAFEREVAQYDLSNKVNKHYSTIFRQLRKLEEKNLVRFVRKERSKKKGKDKKFYGITFLGLLQILFRMTDLEIDEIAKIHSDKWLIFAEWSFLSKIHLFFPYLRVKAVSSKYNYFLESPVSSFLNDELKVIKLENIKQDSTDAVLGLDRIFKRGRLWLGLVPKESNETLTRPMTSLLRARVYMKNPRIKEYINNRFEQEESVHKLIVLAKANWEKLSMQSDV